MAEPPPALEPPAPTTVSENEPLSLLLQSAEDAAGGVLRAKAAVASCRSAAEAARKARVAAEKAQEFAELARSHAEGAARELLVAKKAEIQVGLLVVMKDRQGWCIGIVWILPCPCMGLCTVFNASVSGLPAATKCILSWPGSPASWQA
jgi:hypothetical protein